MENAGANPDSILFDGGKRCNIFVVDYGEHMFQSEGGADFKMALKAVRDRINDLCCSGDLNEVGVVLFINTANTNREAENIDCIYVHHPFGTFGAEYVKQLDELLEAENIRSSMEGTLGESGMCNWAEMFFLCQRLLTYSGSVIRRKAIMIFTRDHDPSDGDEDIQKNIRQRLTDLRGDARGTKVPGMEGVQFGLFLIGTDDENISSFWEKIGVSECVLPIEELENEIRRKNYSLRAISTLPFKLGEGVELAVGVYPLIQEQRKPTALWLDAETNERIESKSHYIASGGGDYDEEAGEDELAEREHYEGEVSYAVKLGKIAKPYCTLSHEEKEKLRRLDSPSITVIGFKPLSALKDSHRMGQSRFVYPLENVNMLHGGAISGSVKLYRALHERCLKRNVFILVRYTQMRNTSPQLAALIPQGRENKADVHHYEGFHLVELPFQEDKREMKSRLVPPRGWKPATQDRIEAAQKFIGRLTGPYTPDQFANPALQRYYSGLETIALDKDFDSFAKEAGNSDTIRAYFDDPERAKRAATQLEAFKKLFEQEEAGGSKVKPSGRQKGRKAQTPLTSDSEDEKPIRKRTKKK